MSQCQIYGTKRHAIGKQVLHAAKAHKQCTVAICCGEFMSRCRPFLKGSAVIVTNICLADLDAIYAITSRAGSGPFQIKITH